MSSIYKRELKSYFDTMIGYVFIAFLTGFMGVYFMVYNLRGGYPYFSITLSAIVFLLLIAVPVLTMKSFAEEKKSKTDQLLLTAPISLGKIVLGKYLAMVSVFFVPVFISLFCPFIIEYYGTAYLKEDYASILAFFSLGCVYIAIGMFLSSLTESQIIAAVSTFGVLLVLNLWSGLTDYLPTSAHGAFWGFLLCITVFSWILYLMTKSWLAAGVVELAGAGVLLFLLFTKSSVLDHALTKVFSKIAVIEVFQNFESYHLFDVSGLILYLSLIFVFLFLTMQTIQKRRWS